MSVDVAESSWAIREVAVIRSASDGGASMSGILLVQEKWQRWSGMSTWEVVVRV